MRGWLQAATVNIRADKKLIRENLNRHVFITDTLSSTIYNINRQFPKLRRQQAGRNEQATTFSVEALHRQKNYNDRDIGRSDLTLSALS
jgi:hypothetical protein